MKYLSLILLLAVGGCHQTPKPPTTQTVYVDRFVGRAAGVSCMCGLTPDGVATITSSTVLISDDSCWFEKNGDQACVPLAAVQAWIQQETQQKSPKPESLGEAITSTGGVPDLAICDGPDGACRSPTDHHPWWTDWHWYHLAPAGPPETERPR